MISRKDGSFLNVSVDAGTRETYREVKGLDAYDRVLSHIRRYAQEGAVIEIKYILMPENCDRENIDGFLAFCKEISPPSTYDQRRSECRSYQSACQDHRRSDLYGASGRKVRNPLQDNAVFWR